MTVFGRGPSIEKGARVFQPYSVLNRNDLSLASGITRSLDGSLPLGTRRDLATSFRIKGDPKASSISVGDHKSAGGTVGGFAAWVDERPGDNNGFENKDGKNVRVIAREHGLPILDKVLPPGDSEIEVTRNVNNGNGKPTQEVVVFVVRHTLGAEK